MKSYIRIVGTLTSVLLLLSLPAGAHAQNVTYEEATLTSLYNSYLKKNSDDSYLEKRIADERVRMRTQADKEVQILVSPTKNEVATGQISKTIDDQRMLVDLLLKKINTLKVDIDLLTEEERKFYAQENEKKDSSNPPLLLTKSHAELLAKKAILQERMAAFDAALSLQQERLRKLSWQQWLSQFQALSGILGYVAILLGAVILDRILRRRIAGRIQANERRYLIAKLVSAGIYTVAAVWILTKLTSDHPGALASLAIVGAGIAVALQDIVKDIMGWILILQRRFFTLGNRISIGSHTGDVIDIGPFRTMMLEVSSTGALNAHERTGKTLFVPNSLILREPILNYNTTSDFMSVEMQVTITYDSDWKAAEEILKECLRSETHEYTEQARIQQRRRTALLYTVWEVSEPEVHIDLAASGILFTLKFTVLIGKRRKTISNLSRMILERFAEASNVHLAYNTIKVVGTQK